MQRVKIQLPEKFSFSTTIQVRITDLNYGGHVGNDCFLSFVHEARQQYLQHFGYTELQLENVALIMADAAIEFKKELYMGNLVHIAVQAAAFDKMGFDIYYLLEVEIDGQKHLAGKAKTGMLCFDYTHKKLMPVPTAVIEKLQMPTT